MQKTIVYYNHDKVRKYTDNNKNSHSLHSVIRALNLDFSTEDISCLSQYSSFHNHKFSVFEIKLLNSFWNTLSIADKSIERFELITNNPHVFRAIRRYRLVENALCIETTTLNSIILSSAAFIDNYNLSDNNEFVLLPLPSAKGNHLYGIISKIKSCATAEQPRAIHTVTTELLASNIIPICTIRIARDNITRQFSKSDTGTYAYEKGMSVTDVLNSSLSDSTTKIETICSFGVISSDLTKEASLPGDKIYVIPYENTTYTDFSTSIKALFDSNASNTIRSIGTGKSVLEKLLSLNVGMKIDAFNIDDTVINNLSKPSDDIILVVKKNKNDSFFNETENLGLSSIQLGIVTRSNYFSLMYNRKTYAKLSLTLLRNCPLKITTAKIYEGQYKQKKKNISEIRESILKTFKNLRFQQDVRIDHMAGGNVLFAPTGGFRNPTPSLVSGYDLSKFEKEKALIVAVANCSDTFKYTPFLSAINATILAISKLILQGVSLAYTGIVLHCLYPLMKDNIIDDPASVAFACFYAVDQLNVRVLSSDFTPSPNITEASVTMFACGVEVQEQSAKKVFEKKSRAYKLPLRRDKYYVPDFKYLIKLYSIINIGIGRGNIQSATIIEDDIMTTIMKSLAADGSGFSFAKRTSELLQSEVGDFIITASDMSDFASIDYEYIGFVNENSIIKTIEADLDFGHISDMILPIKPNPKLQINEYTLYNNTKISIPPKSVQPTVFIPVVDIASSNQLSASFENAGALIKKQFVPSELTNYELLKKSAEQISRSQILALSACNKLDAQLDKHSRFYKFFINPIIINAVNKLLENGGLILGLGEGFRSLLELNLIQFGSISAKMATDIKFINFDSSVALTEGTTGVLTSSLSPWMYGTNLSQAFTIPISLNPGRLIIPENTMRDLDANGQIVSRYVDPMLIPTMQSPYNPNNADFAVESICSQDGRILGRTGHYERIHKFRNVPEDADNNLFKRGIDFFK
ncbi:MAG: phosphoribosylformylglycinamidine synthase subunit PurQ [Christensenellaceae bacterium]|jgi:phosphoribosylformylglycinamidine (FGAM) synthase-like amidotransferase family enzyme|nr:phosphoribosylformylglycinamidine synthase subunit PurQ [Christensenellaceae bacterium]